MQIAQQLYEGVNFGSDRIGLITYMRTDSTRISETALKEVREFIAVQYAKELPEQAIQYAVGAKAQDAHEGIRPTYAQYTPEYVKEYLNRDQLRLYTIIWERFVSSQMTNAKSRTTTVEISAGDAKFRASKSKLVEKGFYQVIKLLSTKEEQSGKLPSLKIEEKLNVVGFTPAQHFTQGPDRKSVV